MSKKNVLAISIIALLILAAVLVMRLGQLEQSRRLAQKYAQQAGGETMQRLPDTALSRALVGNRHGSGPAAVEAEEADIEAALAKYGTHDPWASKAFYNMGMCNWQLRKYKDALADLDACVKLPEPFSGLHLSAYQMRMIIRMEMNDLQGAIEASRDLMKADGPMAQKRKLQSTALLLRAEWQSMLSKKEKNSDGMKDAAESYREFQRYQAKYPSKTGQKYTAFALGALGASLQREGKTDEALKVYGEYLRKYPKALDAIKIAMDRLAILCHGQDKISTNDLEKICSLYPINSGYGQQVLYQLGWNYYVAGKFQLASKPLHKAWHIVPAKEDTQYSVDLAGEAALLEIRALNLAGMVLERDSVAKEIISHFKGTKYEKEAQKALAVYQASTQIFWGSNLIKIAAIMAVLAIIGFRMFVVLRGQRRGQN